MTYSPKIATKV